MFASLGFALIFVAGVAMLFALAVFQAASVEVRQRNRGLLLTLETVTAREAPDLELDRDDDLARAA